MNCNKVFLLGTMSVYMNELRCNGICGCVM